jgi:hypothetical protein
MEKEIKKSEERRLKCEFLSIYLPHNLNCIVDGKQLLLESLSNNRCKFFDDEYTYDYSGVLPILRPLTDLTKQQKIDGKIFVPAEYLWGWDCDEEKEFTLNGIIPSMWEHALLMGTSCWDFGWITKCVKMNFDVFGLIEIELAIDINKLP